MIGTEHRYDTMPQAYAATLGKILDHGHHVSPRGLHTKELIGHSFTLTSVDQNVVTQATRKVSLPFMAAEFLWLVSGSNDARLIIPYNASIEQYAYQVQDIPLYFQGAYGPKISDQLPYIIETLTGDRDSRQALLTIWRERPGPSKDIPCTCLMQFFIRNSLLDMVVYMRSNDAWLGLPYDVFNFTMLQRYIASLLEIEPGWYHHHVGSLHLYEKHWAKAYRVLDEDINDIPIVEGSPLVAPLPPETWTVFTGMSLMGSHVGMSVQDVNTWIDLSGSNQYPGWLELLKLCAYRFHKNPTLIPAQHQALIRYQDVYLDKQAGLWK